MSIHTKGPPQLRSPFLTSLLILLVLAGAAFVLPPFDSGSRKNAETIRSLNNARGIKSALDLFASDFDGHYPNDETAKDLISLAKHFHLPAPEKPSSPPSTSNYYFNQLIGRGLDDEEIFFDASFKTHFRLRKPNNDGVVDQGENVWGYTKNLKQTSSSHLPLVFSSPLWMSNGPQFSKKIHGNGKIIIARLDSSTRTETIGGIDPKVGNVTSLVDGERMNLFSQEALEEGIMVPADLKHIGSED